RAPSALSSTGAASARKSAESPIEQALRFGRARLFARQTVDDEDQALALAHRRRGDAVAAGGGLPGLDPVRAGVLAEQRVAVRVALAAETELALGEHAVALGVALQNEAGQLRHVGCGHAMILGRVARSVGEPAAGETERLCGRGHDLGERRFGLAEML